MYGVPDSTGWTLFSSIETANRGDKSPTALATSSFEVKIYASFSLKNKKNKNRRNPIVNDVRTIMFTANFAPFALPFPSSFATLTLQINIDKN